RARRRRFLSIWSEQKGELCFFAMASLSLRKNLFRKGRTDGLAGVLAYYPAGSAGRSMLVGHRITRCLLDNLFALAVEVPRGGNCRAANRSPSHGAGILCSGGA